MGAAEDVINNALPLSKNAAKKLLKRERVLAGRAAKKRDAREQRRTAAVAEGRDLPAERRELAARTAAGDGWRRRQLLWETEKQPLAATSFQVCIDCAFEPHMTAKELASLASQIRCCYSYNKRNAHPCLMTVTGLSGTTLELLENETGYAEWSKRAYVGTAQPLADYYHDRLSDVVYLTSDADRVLHDLDDDKIYVIGGIVDRNRLGRAAFDRAQSLRVATARLPLAEHVRCLASTRVLTCNHVFDLLLQYRGAAGRDWRAALRAVLPARKEAVYREDSLDQGDRGVVTAPRLS